MTWNSVQQNYVDGKTVINAEFLNTLQDKVSEFVSVKDFGAVGDGVTDDTQAINAAINSISSGVIYFPTGTYRISPVVYLTYCLVQKSGQIWRGAGRDASRLLLSPSVTNLTRVIITENNATHYGMEDLCIDGNRLNITPSGVDLYSTFNLVVGPDGGGHGSYRRLLLKNSWGRTLQTGYESGSNRVKNVIVDDVVVLNAGTKAISGTKTDGITIQNCYAEVNPYTDAENPLAGEAGSGSCFESNACTDMLIIGCRGKQVGTVDAPGIRLINGSKNIKVTQCAIDDASYLGFIQNSDDVEFSHNVGRNITNNGVLIADSDAANPTDTCKRIYVHKNKIDQVTSAFVFVTAKKSGYDSYVEAYVYDNVFIGNSQYGIYNEGVISPATGGNCDLYQWNNTLTGTHSGGTYAGPADHEIQPPPDRAQAAVRGHPVRPAGAGHLCHHARPAHVL